MGSKTTAIQAQCVEVWALLFCLFTKRVCVYRPISNWQFVALLCSTTKTCRSVYLYFCLCFFAGGAAIFIYYGACRIRFRLRFPFCVRYGLQSQKKLKYYISIEICDLGQHMSQRSFLATNGYHHMQSGSKRIFIDVDVS